MANQKVYEVITDKVITRIKNAIENKESFSWVKPWKGYPTGNFTRYISNPDKFMEYRGINRLLLDGGLYITMKQLNDLEKKDDKEYKIKKGSHRETIYFYKPRLVEVKDENGEIMLDDDGEPVTRRYMIIRFYNVFNIADIEGLDSYAIPEIDTEYDENKLTKKADKIIKLFAKRDGVVIKNKKGIDKAYYQPGTHTVVVPNKSQFKSIEEYYSTVFHELTHSTSKNLNRELGNKFGTEKYSFEELVAELGALFLMQTVGFDTSKTEINSTAYLKGWLKKLKDDTSMIVKASNKAQQALDYIMDIKFDDNEATEVEIVEDDDDKVIFA